MRNVHRVDYMTIDTEGSEVDIVQDFPWNEFDVRVVQIEQLVAARYPAQAGRKENIIQHMENHGYKLLAVYPVAKFDTDDLIFIRNIDVNLYMTRERPGSRRWPHEYSKESLRPKSSTTSSLNTADMSEPSVTRTGIQLTVRTNETHTVPNVSAWILERSGR